MGITYLRVNFLECQLQPKLNHSKIATFGHSTVRFNYLSVFVFYLFFLSGSILITLLLALTTRTGEDNFALKRAEVKLVCRESYACFSTAFRY